MIHGIASLIFGVLVIGVVFIIALVVAVLGALFRGGRSPWREEDRAEETKMIQEMYQDLETMEKRIEALETLVLEAEDDATTEKSREEAPR
jgi:phage shock protein B